MAFNQKAGSSTQQITISFHAFWVFHCIIISKLTNFKIRITQNCACHYDNTINFKNRLNVHHLIRPSRLYSSLLMTQTRIKNKPKHQFDCCVDFFRQCFQYNFAISFIDKSYYAVLFYAALSMHNELSIQFNFLASNLKLSNPMKDFTHTKLVIANHK